MSTSNALRERELREAIRHNKADEEAKRIAAEAKARDAVTNEYKAGYSDPRTPYNAVNQGVSHGVNLFGSLAKASNDFGWYTQYRDLVMNLLKQPVTAKAGVGVSRDINDLFYQATNPVMPGKYHMNKNCIFSYDFIPSLGNCNGQQSPTSIAVRELFTKVRASNSGSTNYDAADLFQFPLAMDSIYYTLAWILRGIALVNFVNPREPFTVAYQLLQVHCFNDASLVSDFIYNKNDIITLYNSAISRVNALNVPLELSFIKRHVFLTESVFYAGEHVGRTYTLLNPSVYYVYDELNSKLEAKDFYSNIKLVNLVNGIRRVLDQMILPLELSQTISIMSGDIAKANFTCIKLPSIQLEQGESMLPSLINDIKYMQSFKNADLFNVADISEFSIKQGIDSNNNPFLYQGTWNSSLWVGPEFAELYVDYYDGAGTYQQNEELIPPQLAVDVLVDYYDENSITEEDQCYNFSFKFTLSRDGSAIHLAHSRSEVLVKFRQFEFDMSSGTLVTAVEKRTNVLSFNIDITRSVEDEAQKLHQGIHAVNLLAMTDYAPRFYYNVPVYFDSTTKLNYCEVIWNRNRNRNFVSLDLANDILDYTLRSMFCINNNAERSENITNSGNASATGKSNSKKPKRSKGKKPNKGKKPKEDKTPKEDKK
jgi:hypothetical protein